MTYKEYAASLSDTELSKEIKELDETIHRFHCFGKRDLMLLEALDTELLNREMATS